MVLDQLGDSKKDTSGGRPIIVIDSMNIFIRHFAVNETVTTSGEPCGGVVGFIKALNSLVLKFAPEKVIVVWEQGGGSSRRKKIFPEYKANRTKLKSEFSNINKDKNSLPSKRWIMDDVENKLKQVKILVDALKFLPVCQIYVPEVECDDVVAYLMRHKLNKLPNLKILVSSDRDFYQLLDIPNTKILNPADKSFHDGPLVKVKVAKDEYIDIPAKNYVIVRTLTGDASDNIPGVSGLGFKTVIKHFPEILKEDLELTTNEIIDLARTKVESISQLPKKNKSIPKVLSSVLESSDILKRNWQLMFLDSSNLAGSQISKIEFTVDNFQPRMNKIELIKHLLKEGIVSDINFDLLAYQMQANLLF